MALSQPISGVYAALIERLDAAGLGAQEAHRMEGTPEDAAEMGRIRRGALPALLLFPAPSSGEESTLSGIGHPNRLDLNIDIVVMQTLGGETSAKMPETLDEVAKGLDDLADAVFDDLQQIFSPMADLSLAQGTTMTIESITPLVDVGRFDWAGRAVRAVFKVPVDTA